MKGYVQVYTGNGKGKTTAALGLALRAAGAGLRVFIGQFAKGRPYSEIKSLGRFDDLITLRQYGSGCFIFGEPRQEDRDAAARGLAEIREAVSSGRYDVVILDEANIATFYNLVNIEELLAVIDQRPPHVELILTGRNAHEQILSRADLITEMLEVKHYYAAGVEARDGIEQ